MNFLIVFTSVAFLSLSYIAIHEFIRLYQFEKKLKERIKSHIERETGLTNISTSNKRRLNDRRIVYLAYEDSNKFFSNKDARFFQVYISNMQIDSYEEILLHEKKAA